VVEPDDDRVRLRFGDGALGRPPAPGLGFKASYRLGNGSRGNVGAEAVSHLVAPSGAKASDVPVTSVRNPLPAQGGLDPEPLDLAKLAAPEAYRTPLRAVTAADWVDLAERHPAVRSAACEVTSTGGQTVFTVAVQPKNEISLDIDFLFLVAVQRWLVQFRLAGSSLALELPDPVSVEIALVAWIRAGASANGVRAALARAFSDSTGGVGGAPGFFAPGRFTLGEPVYLSRVVTTALSVPGVAWLDTDPRSDPRVRFARRGEGVDATIRNVSQGKIPIGAFEVAQAESRAASPDAGQVYFYIVEDA
jgi:predicted phage baseplate assembly protein